MYSGSIRLYSAYHLDDPPLYDLAMLTCIRVLMEYLGDFVVWRTVGARVVVIPLVTAAIVVWWMVMQRGYYGGASV
jgi:hypothetical protein